MTAPARITGVTARTPIHRGNQLEACRKFALARGARDHDATGLQRLAQPFEHAAIPFRQFAEEQHTVMRQRHFPGARVAARARRWDDVACWLSRVERDPLAAPLRAWLARARELGVEVRTGAKVEALEVEHGRVAAVVLKGGERLVAEGVASPTAHARRRGGRRACRRGATPARPGRSGT